MAINKKEKTDKKSKKSAKAKNLTAIADSEKQSAQKSESKKVPFAVVEAYKSIRTNLMFVLAQNNGNTIAVTSANAGEGKSTTTVNLAIAFSQMGDKVLLIDADLRRSSVHKKLKIENESGLSNVLAGLSKIEDAITKFNDSLDVLTAGQIPPNPSELLGSQRFATLIEEMRSKYTYILIDTPPVNVVSDALVIAPHTDGLVLVLRDTITPKDTLKHAISSAEFANINIIGAIMNGANPISGRKYVYRKYYRSKYYSKYGYNKYGYGKKGYGYGYGYGGSYGSSYGGYGGYESASGGTGEETPENNS